MDRLDDRKHPDFREVLDSSELPGAVKPYKASRGKSVLFGDAVRRLTDEEIDRLISQGNSSDSWESVWVREGFTTDFVQHSLFCGECVLGVFNGEEMPVAEGLNLRNGVYRSTLINSEIGNNALVHDTGVISNYKVGDRAVVYSVGALMAGGECAFGNGRYISMGIETGGREVRLYAEITVQLAWVIAVKRADRELQQKYSDFVDSYISSVTLPFGVVAEGCIISSVSKVLDAWIGRGVKVDCALLLEDCALLGSDEESAIIGDGASVVRSCVQWGSEVTSMAIVEDSVLTEHSKVERHGKVTGSIIGPNTSIAEGEVTASLVGPFVGFHHQALLIAALWPDGKGNIGYGANIGSNHTSKAPDQELLCGEGMFFGLGVNIKYPSNFIDAPYSIIATSVDTLPQRVEFPFSLINRPRVVPANISQSYNEIFPGWVLSNNIYMVRRNESKYGKRNRARRSLFVFDVFRRNTVEKMVLARERLRRRGKKNRYYTEKDIDGLGKNFLTEESRKKGIESYTFFIRYYALSGLKTRAALLLERGDPDAVSRIYADKGGEGEWEYQRVLLHGEGLADRDPAPNLMDLLAMQERIAKSTEGSKERDDLRGKEILKGYYDAHTEAVRDPFVIETWEETRKIKREIEAIIKGIESAV